MDKEHARREKLKAMDERARAEEERKLKEAEAKHKEHPKLHHPVWFFRSIVRPDLKILIFREASNNLKRFGKKPTGCKRKILTQKPSSCYTVIVIFLVNAVDVNILFCLFWDLNQDNFLDYSELEALFQKELDKMYDPNRPEDDMRERQEEMARMREHVIKEVSDHWTWKLVEKPEAKFSSNFHLRVTRLFR